jgi:hypothetical protein
MGEGVRPGDRRGRGDAARVGVLDDRDRRGLVVERGTHRRIPVDVVVVRHLFALQLAGLGDADPVRAEVESRALV